MRRWLKGKYIRLALQYRHIRLLRNILFLEVKRCFVANMSTARRPFFLNHWSSLVCVGGKSHRKSQARFVRPANNLTVGQDFRPGLANVSGAGYPLNVHDCMCFDDAIIRARAFTSHVWRVGQRSSQSWVFSGYFGFLPQGLIWPFHCCCMSFMAWITSCQIHKPRNSANTDNTAL